MGRAPVAVAEQARLALGRVELQQANDLPPDTLGWAWDPVTHVLTVSVRTDAQGHARVDTLGLSYSAPVTPQNLTQRGSG